MQQPVRKSITVNRTELSHKRVNTLLVDGTNLLKISMADPMVNSKGEHIGGIFQFLLQLKIQMSRRDWDFVYVFFDDERSGILRYEIYPHYKENRDKNYGLKGPSYDEMSEYMKAFNAKVASMEKYFYGKRAEQSKPVSEEERRREELKRKEKENFARERERLMMYFDELYIRYMIGGDTECDDLISYYIMNKQPWEKITIMSSDEDLTQLISEDVEIYDTKHKKTYTTENFRAEKGYPFENVLVKKIFCGDTSDNITNINGLSEARLFELIPEMKTRPVTVNEVKERAVRSNEERISQKKKPFKYCENIVNGVSNKKLNGDFYEIQDKLINLSHPLLSSESVEELKGMMHVPQDPEGRSISNLYTLLREDDISELYSDNKFSSFFASFKKVEEREKKFFSEFSTKN